MRCCARTRCDKHYLVLVLGRWELGHKHMTRRAAHRHCASAASAPCASIRRARSRTPNSAGRAVLGKRATLLEATLHTGRTHQIRVHAAYCGHPVAGDEKYGDEAANEAASRPWACGGCSCMRTLLVRMAGRRASRASVRRCRTTCARCWMRWPGRSAGNAASAQAQRLRQRVPAARAGSPPGGSAAGPPAPVGSSLARPRTARCRGASRPEAAGAVEAVVRRPRSVRSRPRVSLRKRTSVTSVKAVERLPRRYCTATAVWKRATRPDRCAQLPTAALAVPGLSQHRLSVAQAPPGRCR